MGRKSREKRDRTEGNQRQARQLYGVRPELAPLRDLAELHDTEPFTPDLEQELLARGALWTREFIEAAKEEGGRYNRSRDSVVFPTEFGGPMFNSRELIESDDENSRPIFIYHGYGLIFDQYLGSREDLELMGWPDLGVTNPSLEGTVRMSQIKNRHTYVSGPEPPGKRKLIPIPDIITPEIDVKIKEWLKQMRMPPAS